MSTTKALDDLWMIDAGVVAIYLYQGARRLSNTPRWEELVRALGGEIGIAMYLASFALELATEIDLAYDRTSAGFPGVVHYELVEPFGEYLAKEGPLRREAVEEFRVRLNKWLGLDFEGEVK